MLIEEDVAAALARLGDTPDAVAATLRAAGVRGDREDTYRHPVANWLAGRFPGETFEADPYSVYSPGLEAADLPPAVRGFAAAFDAGLYPDLESPVASLPMMAEDLKKKPEKQGSST